MSYIRGMSNPEALYIFGSGRGRVEICVAGKIVTIPRHVFHGILRRWHENKGENVTYRGAAMTEIIVHSPPKPTRFRFALTYSDWSILAYEVTWEYLCAQFKWYRRGVRV